jgi:DNA-binding MarR family transcriptional regulator
LEINVSVISAKRLGDKMASFKPTLNDDEKAYCRSLMLALEPFRDIRSTMPLQYVYTFLMVATDEGKGSTEYAKEQGISNTVMTRHMLDIGDRNRQREEGFGLITQERDLHDLRRHHARVTPTGKALVRKLMNALRTVPKPKPNVDDVAALAAQLSPDERAALTQRLAA